MSNIFAINAYIIAITSPTNANSITFLLTFMFDGSFGISAVSTTCILFILYMSFTSSENTFAISFAICVAYIGSSFDTVISISSVSFTELTVIFFLKLSSFTSMFKFDITFLNTFLLFTNSLYVDTNFEFSVTSVVVIEFVAS